PVVRIGADDLALRQGEGRAGREARGEAGVRQVGRELLGEPAVGAPRGDPLHLPRPGAEREAGEGMRGGPPAGGARPGPRAGERRLGPGQAERNPRPGRRGGGTGVRRTGEDGEREKKGDGDLQSPHEDLLGSRLSSPSALYSLASSAGRQRSTEAVDVSSF